MKKITYQVDIKTASAKKNVKSLNNDLGKTEKQVKKTSDSMSSAFNALPSSIQGVANQVKGLGTSFKALAVGAGVGAIAGIGALFVTASKKGAEFAKELSGLKAVLGASDNEINKLSKSAKDLGASTQFTAKEVVGLQTEFAKLGFTTKEILKSTKATLDLAASLDVGLGEAASIAGSTLRAFGLQAEETQKVVDIMAKSTAKSALDYDSLRESLKLVAPTSRAMNVSIEETTALLATLADNGLKGSIAGTGLSKTFIELNKKGIPLSEALEKVKNSSNALNTAIDLVGVVGSKSLLTLANNAPKIDVLTKSFQNSQGAAQRLAETRLDNLAGDTTKLGSAWEGFLLSIEDGEGLFSSIARGIVQATTSLLNFITPTEKLSESLEKERKSLFRVQAELGNVNTTQEERTSLILELQKQYPEYLKNIDAETASSEDLNKAIQEINKSLINKILIQEREEEIQEQAEETAKELNKVLDKEAKTLDYTAKLRQKYSDLGIQIKATSPNEVLKELNQIQEKENKLREEGNGQNKLKISDIGKLVNEQINLQSKIKALNEAEEDFQKEQEKGNALIKEKDALMERLGITTEKSTNKIDNNASSTENLTIQTKDLIKIQEELLDQAKGLPQTTEKELIVKNRKIATIEKEIKRLKSLGIEQKKVAKAKKEANKEEVVDLEKLERQKQKAAQDEINREDAQFNLLQEIRNNAQQQELLKLAQNYDKKFALANGNFELEKALTEQQALDIAAINEKYRKKESETKAELTNTAREQRQADMDSAVSSANQILGSITSLAQQSQQKFADLNQSVLDNENTTDKEKQKLLDKNNKRAKKAFDNAKAAQIAAALINTYSAAAAALAPPPLGAGPIFGPIAAAAALVSGFANVNQIRKQKFEATTLGSSGGGSASSGSGGGPSQQQAPQFNVVGQSGFNQIAGALGRSGPLQAYVVAGQVTTQQQLNNAIINRATF